MTELNVVSRSRDSGLLWLRSRGNILEVPKPQHLLPCPLQLLEMSFNCLEDVESTIPVSPLHLAVSPAFSFCLPCPYLPQAHTKVHALVTLSLVSAFLQGHCKQAVT